MDMHPLTTANFIGEVSISAVVFSVAHSVARDATEVATGEFTIGAGWKAFK